MHMGLSRGRLSWSSCSCQSFCLKFSWRWNRSKETRGVILVEWSILVPSFLSLRETGQRRATVGVIKWRLTLMLRHLCCWLRCTDVWPFGMSDRFLVNDGVGGQLKAKHHRVRTTRSATERHCRTGTFKVCKKVDNGQHHTEVWGLTV